MHLIETIQQAQSIATQIKPGMTRDQVELLFLRHLGGIMGPVIYHHLVTIYNTGDIRVEIPFDVYGGQASGKNRVLETAKVFIDDVNWLEYQKRSQVQQATFS